MEWIKHLFPLCRSVSPFHSQHLQGGLSRQGRLTHTQPVKHQLPDTQVLGRYTGSYAQVVEPLCQLRLDVALDQLGRCRVDQLWDRCNGESWVSACLHGSTEKCDAFKVHTHAQKTTLKRIVARATSLTPWFLASRSPSNASSQSCTSPACAMWVTSNDYTHS